MKKWATFLLTLCCIFLAPDGLAESELPATLYHNPAGGSYYHADANCPSVHTKYLPLTPFDSTLLPSAPYSELKPCPCCLSGVKAVVPTYQPSAADEGNIASQTSDAAAIETSMQAAAFANAFFTSPYVGEANVPEGLSVTISQTEDGWRAEAIGTGGAQLTLLFDEKGHVALYQNVDYPLPMLEDGALPIEEADDTAYPWDVLSSIDEITRSYFGKSYDAIACYGVKGDTYAYQMDLFDFFVLCRIEPTFKLVGLGDLSQNACSYDGYLSRGEAVTLAREALGSAYGLSTAQTNALVLSQTSFNPNAYQPLADDLPLTYWYIGFAITSDGKNGAYQVELDAKTGEILETKNPDTSGQG